jgi:hypothetical protein
MLKLANIAELNLLLKSLEGAVKSRELSKALSFQKEFDNLLKETTFNFDSSDELSDFIDRYSLLVEEIILLQSKSKVDIASFKSNTKKIAKYNL